MEPLIMGLLIVPNTNDADRWRQIVNTFAERDNTERDGCMLAETKI
jgi:hypothetical protein